MIKSIKNKGESMKNILILYASYGGGHLSAAKSIQKYLDDHYAEIHAETVDCMKYINKILEKVTTSAYKEMAKKAPSLWGKVYSDSQSGVLSHISSRSNKVMAIKLKHLIEEKTPDLVISTHPFSSQMVSYLRRKGKVHCKLATVMTDFAPHDQWLIGHEYTDLFFVSHEEMKKNLVDYGVDASKVFATGIPLSDRFFQKYDHDKVLKEFDLNPNRKTILFFGGGEFGLGKNRTIEIFRALLNNINDYQLVAIAGKNESLYNEFNQIVEELHKKDIVKVLGFTDKVPELMSISELVITKPGGLTTTESLACNLPMIIINPIPGQEEENAAFLEQKGAAVWIKKEDNPGEILMEILHSNNKLDEMRNNTKLIGKINSTRDICEIVIKNI